MTTKPAAGPSEHAKAYWHHHDAADRALKMGCHDEAQVHATLALASATAGVATHTYMASTFEVWHATVRPVERIADALELLTPPRRRWWRRSPDAPPADATPADPR